MKILIGHDVQNGMTFGNYLFNPSTNQITFLNLSINLADEQLLLITDTTAGIILYNFANVALQGNISNNVLTLAYNCSALSSTDTLQIYVDVPTTTHLDTASAIDADLHLLLQKMCDLLEPLSTQDNAQRQRVTVDSITAGQTITTVGTVSTITGGTITTITNAVPVGNVATIGGGNPEWQMIDMSRTAYNTGIRSQLIFGN